MEKQNRTNNSLTEKMKIGFDAKRIVRNTTGLGSYSRTLVNDLSHIVSEGTELLLYAPDKGRDELRRQVEETDSVRYVYPEGPKTRLSRDIWRIKGIVKDLKRDGVKLFHGLTGELPLGIRKSGIKTVVTIHDLIFMVHPEYYNWIDTKIYAWKFYNTCREADRIIAISECTKRDIMRFGNVDPSKIDVIYQSCSTEFKCRESEKKLQQVHTDYMLPERYIVNVGTIEERKNILLAVKAMQLLPEDLSLVIVGRFTPYTDKVKEYVAANNLGDRVKFLHGVPHDDLPAIYQMAEACVYPSRYEGFGLPIIEAIQSGLPVVACTGSCLEEAGGNASIYVKPDDVYGMAEAIKKVLAGAPGREERILKSQQYVTRFEGNNVAQKVLDVYNKVCR